MTNTQFSTKDRILGAAEELFAQHGFSGTSLRQVTSRADVNIAAVNYHFGSKENLVTEVFRRRMDEMSAQRLAQLRQAQEQAPGELEPILAAFVEHALALAKDRNGGGAFIRGIGWVYATRHCALRKGRSERYVSVLGDCARAMATSGPERGKEQLYWRLYCLTGALTDAMDDFGLIKRASGVSDTSHRSKAAQELIRFAAAGFKS